MLPLGIRCETFGGHATPHRSVVGHRRAHCYLSPGDEASKALPHETNVSVKSPLAHATRHAPIIGDYDRLRLVVEGR